MVNKKIKTAIFGATGLAGSIVLDACIMHSRVNKVTFVSRRSTGKDHDKLKEIIHQNFLEYSSIEDRLIDIKQSLGYTPPLKSRKPVHLYLKSVSL